MLVADSARNKNTMHVRDIFGRVLNVSEHWSNTCRLCYSWRAPLGVSHHIRLQEGTNNSLCASGEVRSSKYASSVSDFYFFNFFSLTSLLSHLQSRALLQSHHTTWVKTWLPWSCTLCHTKVLISPALKELNTNGRVPTSPAERPWTLVVYCTYELLLPSYDLLVLCLC